MEWEVLFMCNLLGVLILTSIACLHVLGVPPEKNAEYITFSETNNKKA